MPSLYDLPSANIMESAAIAVHGPASFRIQSLPVIIEILPLRIRVQLCGKGRKGSRDKREREKKRERERGIDR